MLNSYFHPLLFPVLTLETQINVYLIELNGIDKHKVAHNYHVEGKEPQHPMD